MQQQQQQHYRQQGGAIAQLVEQWSHDPATRCVCIVPFGKALILITTVSRRGPKAVGPLVAYYQAFMLY